MAESSERERDDQGERTRAKQARGKGFLLSQDPVNTEEAQGEKEPRDVKASENTICIEAQDNSSKIREKQEKLVSEQQEKLQESKKIIENLSERVTELTAELAKANEREEKLKNDFIETSKKRADYQQKCAGLSDEVVSLTSKLQESQEQVCMFKQSCENLCAEIAQKDAMAVLMGDALKTHENDLRRECEEKKSIKEREEVARKESERLRRENQSYMAAIRHFQCEIARVNRLLNADESRRRLNTTSGFGQQNQGVLELPRSISEVGSCIVESLD